MKNSRSCLTALFTTALIFAAAGCTEEKPMSRAAKKLGIKVDPTLKQVNESVALLDFNLRQNKWMNCLLTHTLSGIKGEVDQKSKLLSGDILKEIVTEQKGLCEFFTQAGNETKVAFDKIKIQKRMLNPQFIFSVFLSKQESENEAFSEEEIGLFLSLEACAKLEQVAREYSIPTRKCREWKDTSKPSKDAE